MLLSGLDARAPRAGGRSAIPPPSSITDTHPVCYPVPAITPHPKKSRTNKAGLEEDSACRMCWRPCRVIGEG